MAGINIITDMAVMPRQSETNCPVNSNRAGGKVREAGVRVIMLARANSFHAVRKAKIPAAAAPGKTNGKSTRTNAPQVEQPSMRAASSSSFGIVLKKLSISQAVKGIVKAIYIVIIPILVSDKLMRANIINSGKLKAIPGTARASIMPRKIMFLPLNL